MAANKQIIFDLENKPVPQPPDVQQPDGKPATNKPNPEQQKETKDKKRSKTSDLGVRVSMKQVTASPVPHVLPSTQPNQPVITQGQQVLPITDRTTQAPIFNPAIKHPATAVTTNTKQAPIKNKSAAAYKPEITHPAILPVTRKSTKKKTGKKPIFIDFKKRLAMKNAKIAEKEALEAAAEAAATENTDHKGKNGKIAKKSIKHNPTGQKSSRQTTSKKPKENMMF